MSSTPITLHLLGAFRVTRNDQPLTQFATNKTRALLAFLAVEAERPHERSALAGLLWPNMDEPHARRNLTQTLVRLRKALGDAELLRVTRQNIQLPPSDYMQVDVTNFIATATAGLQHNDPDRLAHALTLYKGPLLMGFSLPDSPPFEEWLLFKHEYLQRLFLNAAHTLTEFLLTQGAYVHAQEIAHRQLTLEPWRESAHRQLMAALNGNGQRAAALQHYEQHRLSLLTELDAEPDPLTQALYEQIRAGDNFDEGEMPRAAAPAGMVAPYVVHSGDDTPDLGSFYGRTEELATAVQWLVSDRCRVVTLVGMGGVGKSALATQIVHRAAPDFDVILWRSLLNAPSLAELLRACFTALATAPHSARATTLDEQIDLLLGYLRNRRCLLVLDNLESILQGGGLIPRYRAGYEEYGQLLVRVGQMHHQSCLLVTSREEPPEFAQLVNHHQQQGPVRALSLSGLTDDAAGSILHEHGASGATAALNALARHYSGHPLALKLVADAIRDFYAGSVDTFLQEGTPIFADIRIMLNEQFARLTHLEQEILVWLAIERVPISLAQLAENLREPPSRPVLLEAVYGLRRRSLLEIHGSGFTLQNVVTEHLTDYLVEQICQELESAALGDENEPFALPWLQRFALIKASAQEYIRQSQVRLIVQPVARWLSSNLSESALRATVQRCLDRLRAELPIAPGYAAGNLLNLFIHLGCSTHGYNFSGLHVWQIYLANVDAPGLNFRGADLTGAVFTDTFPSVINVAFTPDGEHLAASCADGTVRLWRVPSGQPVGLFTASNKVLWGLAVSPDGRLVAAVGEDHLVRIWEIESGQLVHQLRGHTHILENVTFSPDGTLLATGGWDRVVQLWDVATGRSLRLFHGHTGAVEALAFHSDLKRQPLLASAGVDMTIRIWNIETGECVHTLTSHTRTINCLAFSPDGTTLLSSSRDREVHLWDTARWQLRRVFRGHEDVVSRIAFSPDGTTIASASCDETIRLWQVDTGALQRVLHGHVGWVHSVAFHPDGVTIASGGSDQTVRIWDTRRAQALHILHGRANWIPALTFTPPGDALIAGYWDHRVRIWDMATETVRHTLCGHSDWVAAVTCSADGTFLASASVDRTVCLWNLQTGQLCATLRGHTAGVSGVSFHPAGGLLASSSQDGTICVWDVAQGRQLQTLTAHTDQVTAVAFSPDGQTLVSGSRDRTVRIWSAETWRVIQILEAPLPPARVYSLALNQDGTMLAVGHNEGTIDIWEMESGQRVRRLHGHAGSVGELVFTPDGQSLASGSEDTTIRLWSIDCNEAYQVWTAHATRTMSLAFQPSIEQDGTPPRLASGGCDELIKIWDIHTGDCLQTLHTPGPYAGMEITGAVGLSETQRTAIKMLGAQETLPPLL